MCLPEKGIQEVEYEEKGVSMDFGTINDIEYCESHIRGGYGYV